MATSYMNSDLTNPKYLYDFVVATTQVSINATMMAYLSGFTGGVIAACYVADDKGHPTLLSYDALVQRAKGTDPFNIPPNTDPSSSKEIDNLKEARFMAGFKATLGLPAGIPPAQLPNIVTLGADTGAVLFTMLCSSFTVVELAASLYGPPTWTSVSQPSDAPWLFSAKVDLRLSTVEQGAYTKLPPDVQNEIKNKTAGAFSVQQLLFDLTTAGLANSPSITGIPPASPAYALVYQYFVSGYFGEMAKAGLPLLSANIVDHSASTSTLVLTDFDLEVCPYLQPNGSPYTNPTPAQQQLATLNYLCAANGHSLPASSPFKWNWVDAADINDHDGVISINRDTFANYFQNQLTGYVTSCCVKPWVRVWMDGLTCNYSWSLTPGNTPTITTQSSLSNPTTGNTVLSYSWSSSAHDAAGLNDDMGELKLENDYSLTVQFVGNQIIVTQHQVIYMYVRSLATSGDGNVVDKLMIDTYTIGIDGTGTLVASGPVTSTQDKSSSPKVNKALDFFTDFNEISDDITNSVRSFAATSLQHMPISTIQNYVFPGGKTFIYKSVGFSYDHDLVSLISYADATPADASLQAQAASSLSQTQPTATQVAAQAAAAAAAAAEAAAKMQASVAQAVQNATGRLFGSAKFGKVYTMPVKAPKVISHTPTAPAALAH